MDAIGNIYLLYCNIILVYIQLFTVFIQAYWQILCTTNVCLHACLPIIYTLQHAYTFTLTSYLFKYVIKISNSKIKIFKLNRSWQK